MNARASECSVLVEVEVELIAGRQEEEEKEGKRLNFSVHFQPITARPGNHGLQRKSLSGDD